nr:hypothetical protein [Planococcus salinarum]
MSNFEERPRLGKRKEEGAPKSIKRVIKKILKYLLVLIVVVAVVLTLFINLSPTFGSNPSKDQEEFYSSFDNYKDGKFVNLPSTIPAGSIDSPPNWIRQMDKPVHPDNCRSLNLIGIKSGRKETV